MQKHDVPFFVSIGEVETGKGLHRHRFSPLGKVSGPIHAIPLLNLSQFSHTGITNRIGSMLSAQYRTVFRGQNFTAHRPRQEPPQGELYIDFVALQITPFAIQPVLVLVVRINLQYINIYQVGAIYRSPPSYIFSKANADGWTAGE